MSENIKPRKVWKALLFSIMMFGIGQIYNGQIKKILILFTCVLATSIIFAVTKLSTTFYGTIAFFSILIVINLFSIIDACISAKKQKNYIPKKYNKWYLHLFFGIIIYCTIWLFFASPFSFNKNYVQYFHVPTTANAPTIQLNDYLVADMQIYKKSEVDYGDIVTCLIDNNLYCYRVVGKPNDTLFVKDNFLTINNKMLDYTFVKKINIDGYQIEEYEETFSNGHKHLIWKYLDFSSEKANTETIIIPHDCYFLMGDNRDNALDSRYIGFVSANEIKGKIIFILYGKSFKRMNINLTR